MKKDILDIADALRANVIDIADAVKQLSNILSDRNDFVFIHEQTPPLHTELIVKSPDGIVYLCSWREAYNIFTVQEKGESSYDWSWKKI